jgi:hypothetical protein
VAVGIVLEGVGPQHGGEDVAQPPHDPVLIEARGRSEHVLQSRGGLRVVGVGVVPGGEVEQVK